MTKQVKILVALFSVALFISSCQQDDSAINPLEEFSQEQNEEFGNTTRSCATEKKMAELLADPAYKKEHEKKFVRLAEYMAQQPQLKNGCASPTIIPVAVHFQSVTGTNISCLRTMAQAQIDILNADYGGTNSDITKWTNEASSSFPGISNGQACIKFCLADKNHPSGFNLSDGQPAVTLNQTSGDFNSSWSGYLNFYIRPNIGGLGYSPLGGSGNGDGVTMNIDGFGTGSGCGNVNPEPPFHLGRTLTHEVGHYLLLDHIWGDGGCNSDDNVSDTPSQTDFNSGCPSLTKTSCNSKDLHMNFMDYADDPCMYMFTAGQVSRSEAYINSSLSILTNNAANVCSEAGDPGNGDTCTKPAQGTVTNLSQTSVRVTWPAISGAIKYRIRYRKTGTSSWATKGSNTPTKTLTNLTANTAYQYQLRTQCASGWTAWTSKYTFTTDGNGGNECEGQEVTVKVVLDYYGSDTSWELTAENGTVIASDGPYSDGQEGAVKTKTVCLDNGCYTLYIDDSYGDGICCDYGDGYAQVNHNGSVIGESDGYFGYYDAIEFCVTNGGVNMTQQNKDNKVLGLPARTAVE